MRDKKINMLEVHNGITLSSDPPIVYIQVTRELMLEP